MPKIINNKHEKMAKKIEFLELDKLVPYEKNTKIHKQYQVDQIVNSINEFGFTNPILISKENGIIAGHGRLMAAKKLKLEKVPVIRLDYLTSEQQKAYIIADNKIAENADWDINLLANELQELNALEFDVSLLGFSDEELDNFLNIEIQEEEEEEEEEEEITIAKNPVTKKGDIWLLGRHRLLCGDCTEVNNIKKLMQNEKADICFTSPPYNVGKTPNGNDNKYINYKDTKEKQDYLSLLCDFTSILLDYTDYVFCNVQSVAGNKIALIEFLYNLKDKYADTIIWDKESAEPAMAKRVLNSRFEYIHIFSNYANRVIGTKNFRGTIDNIFKLYSRINKEYSKIHKATFRIELPLFFIENFSSKSVIDVFGGTGTTLMACEKLKRKCFMAEIDSIYCDVIIERWQKLTGQKAILESTKEKFDDICQKK